MSILMRMLIMSHLIWIYSTIFISGTLMKHTETKDALTNNVLYLYCYRVLARNFKTCVRDSLLGANWRPRMKNMRTHRYQNMTSHHGLTKRVAAPIATSEFEIRYGLFKLTKRSDKLFKCFHTSRSLRTIFCLSFDLP